MADGAGVQRPPPVALQTTLERLSGYAESSELRPGGLASASGAREAKLSWASVGMGEEGDEEDEVVLALRESEGSETREAVSGVRALGNAYTSSQQASHTRPSTMGDAAEA
jgi:hypothetical protein